MAERLYPAFGRLIAYTVAGHHAGLANFGELQRRVWEKVVEDYSGWEGYAGELLATATLAPTADFNANAQPADKAAPGDLRPLIESADGVFREGLDPLSLDGVRRYFQEV